jgi:predicted RNA-binding Zn-ribbon protein involved in translation (DUF1610 family)
MNMKSHTIISITRVLTVAFIAMVSVATSKADSGTRQTFTPVKTMKEAEAIKPGEKIAISCANCGSVTTITVGKDRSFLKGYVCDQCKKKFTTVSNPHGGTIGFYYEDDGGHKSHLLRGM